MSYFFVALTIAFTVYGQVVLKWQMSTYGADLDVNKPFSIFFIFLKPWVISAFCAAFLASLSWMMAINKMPISRAYPYMSINFLLVAILAVLIFKEKMDMYKIMGTIVIMSGVAILSFSEK